MSEGNGIRRRAFKVLTPEILSQTDSKERSKKLSIPAFVRERRIMAKAREVNKKNRLARKLGVEDYPLPDPIWRKYQNSSVEIEKFDLKSCENDDLLFEFGKEIVEHLEAAETAPDAGLQISPSFILPRAFLLDAIHLSASFHCLKLQKQAGKLFTRTECPSPSERAKSLQGFGERYSSTIKTIFQKTKKKWTTISNESKNMNEEVTQNAVKSSIEKQADETNCFDDPDFDAILKKVLDIPEILDEVPAFNFEDCNEFGADALWSFDTSSLLAFGILAEEFISSMISAHIEYSETLETDDEYENNESNDYSISDVSNRSSDYSDFDPELIE